jgi:hypothetical protein
MPTPDFNKLRLVDDSGYRVNRGDHLISYKGDHAKLVDYKTPRNSRDPGSVTVRWLHARRPDFMETDNVDYRPGLFNLEWSID